MPITEQSLTSSAVIRVAVWSGSGMASAYFVKKSWTTNNYRLLLCDKGTSRMSTAIISQGRPIGTFISGARIGWESLAF